MDKINEKMELQEIVSLNLNSYKVLEKYRLDYCCGGKNTLEDACKEKALDAKQIIEEINSLKKEEVLVDVDRLSLLDLVEHIKSTHHVFVKKEIPEILALVEKVVGVHKTDNLVKLKDLFKTLVEDISMHLEKEEQILFPAVEELEKYGKVQNFACADKTKNPLATIKNPIDQMFLEHENAGKLLEKINAIIDADDFAKCKTLQILHDKLKAFEEDLHRHIHKENYILFPKVIAKENES
ncbi:MAG: Iron-sulfur cluster repair protein YtfE [Candidatus Anoxychlamydiales bacterium]|nr:Iron-sulfur cluster repair protein YtfE [Candidatus Anoxychlamydiales bacterium]